MKHNCDACKEKGNGGECKRARSAKKRAPQKRVQVSQVSMESVRREVQEERCKKKCAMEREHEREVKGQI